MSYDLLSSPLLSPVEDLLLIGMLEVNITGDISHPFFYAQGSESSQMQVWSLSSSQHSCEMLQPSPPLHDQSCVSSSEKPALRWHVYQTSQSQPKQRNRVPWSVVSTSCTAPTATGLLSPSISDRQSSAVISGPPLPVSSSREVRTYTATFDPIEQGAWDSQGAFDSAHDDDLHRFSESSSPYVLCVKIVSKIC